MAMDADMECDLLSHSAFHMTHITHRHCDICCIFLGQHDEVSVAQFPQDLVDLPSSRFRASLLPYSDPLDCQTSAYLLTIRSFTTHTSTVEESNIHTHSRHHGGHGTQIDRRGRRGREGRQATPQCPETQRHY